MKKIVAYTLFFLLVVGGLCTLRLCRGPLLESRCGEVYHRYAHKEGVEAAYVRGFPINDTISVDVTLLRALDSAGWDYLMGAFHISSELVEAAERNPGFDIWVNQSLRGEPETTYSSIDSAASPHIVPEIVVKSFSRREICVFHTRTRQEHDAVFIKNLMSNK